MLIKCTRAKTADCKDDHCIFAHPVKKHHVPDSYGLFSNGPSDFEQGEVVLWWIYLPKTGLDCCGAFQKAEKL